MKLIEMCDPITRNWLILLNIYKLETVHYKTVLYFSILCKNLALKLRNYHYRNALGMDSVECLVLTPTYPQAILRGGLEYDVCRFGANRFSNMERG